MKKFLNAHGVHYGRYATAWELQIGKIWVRVPYPAYLKVGCKPFIRWVKDDE